MKCNHCQLAKNTFSHFSVTLYRQILKSLAESLRQCIESLTEYLFHSPDMAKGDTILQIES